MVLACYVLCAMCYCMWMKNEWIKSLQRPVFFYHSTLHSSKQLNTKEEKANPKELPPSSNAGSVTSTRSTSPVPGYGKVGWLETETEEKQIQSINQSRLSVSHFPLSRAVLSFPQALKPRSPSSHLISVISYSTPLPLRSSTT